MTTVHHFPISINCKNKDFIKDNNQEKCIGELIQGNEISHPRHQMGNEPPHDKTENDCLPSEDSDQPGHPPSLIRVFTVRFMGS